MSVADRPGDFRPILISTAHQLLAELVRSGAHPASDSFGVTDGGWAVTVSVSRAGSLPLAERTPCERDLIAVLSGRADRLTTGRVLEELERRGLVHGERTVKGALAHLVTLGLVCNSRKAPRGYYLAPDELRQPA